MQYARALRYVHTFLNYERIPFRYRRAFSLKRIERALERLGHPEHTFPSVVVAGTTGKGSTANFIASILTANGFRTGIYSSPHLSGLRERIRIDGAAIPRRDFADTVSGIKSAFGQKRFFELDLGPLTFFEFCTLVAIVYFARRQVSFAVFEVGLGGRLDATNVLTPLVSVLTRIGFDHEEHLGRSIKSIAFEKASIIKPGTRVVSARQTRTALRVIRARMAKVRASGAFPGISYRARVRKYSIGGSRFDFVMNGLRLKGLRLTMPGRFQVENAAAAVAAVKLLETEYGIRLQEPLLRRGLRDAFLPARLEVFCREGSIFIVDGAHNGESIRALCQDLRHFLGPAERIVIFGTSREKNLNRILPLLMAGASLFIATKSRNPRAQEPKIICDLLRQEGFSKPLLYAPSVPEALALAERFQGKKSVKLVCGSMFLAAEAREYLGCPKFA